MQVQLPGQGEVSAGGAGEGGAVKPHKWSHAMEVMEEIQRNKAAPGSVQERFNLPATEIVVDKFMCAIKETILLQGTLYVFPHFVGFGCDLPGHSRTILIGIEDIDSLEKAKFGLVPNSIEIVSGDKKYHFASFFHRGKAFDSIFNLWVVAKCISTMTSPK
eukprot:CAMPEP_0113679122 /NCGR_PEP_ID=MMETSP0038_2-20120614/10406_1 /TAXON_ID=2898 /ORGANISM="Cryptomonas paramecium" /LENGTH=160 /DNA_ID=CAMNT_0000596993 /DNA_START=45 /DNA_END=527 /DNA_ORIENTATION=- /assembly_acc=CAM_ASM_000170